MVELDEASIFNAARKIERSDEREAYLREACGDNLSAYESITTLLRAYEAEPAFLESPPTELGVHTDTASVTEGPGTLIGRYKLLERIGEGGFAVVYMAEQAEPIRRQVALKIIKLGMDTRQVIARFEAERQALALMDHPNIAKVYDAGATDTGRPYFVMQLIRGVPITEYCDQNRLSTAARLHVFQDVCHAVQHAHQKGIIHRDIKPTNVLVALHDGRPVVKVIDFGIAKATRQRLTEKTLYTNYRQIIGTPQYMSPEQAEFSDLDIDTRSDIYSLGVLLYELLTSTTPFQLDDLHQMGYDDICHTIRHSEPPTPSRRLSTLGDAATAAAKNRQLDPAGLRKLLHGDLDWIVMKALEKDRTRRYETADALALDVQRYLAGEPISAGRTSGIERLWRWTKRNRLIAVLSLTVAVLVMLVAITGPMIAWHQARLVEETRQQLYVKDVSIAYNAWNEGDLAHARKLLDNYAAGSQFAHLRDFPWYYLQGLYQRTTASLMPASEFDVALRKNLIAVVKDGHQIHLYDLQNWSEVGLFRLEKQRLHKVHFSPDGRYLAAAYDNGTLSVWEIATRQHLYTIKTDSHDARVMSRVYSPRFSPDGLILATGGADHEVKLWETTSGKPLRVLTGHQDGVLAIAFSPDGKTLATASMDDSLRLWDTNTWTARAVMEHAFTNRVFALAYDPSGTRLAAGGYDSEISIWDAAGQRLGGLPSPGSSLCFSPDGKFLAVGAVSQGSAHVWDYQTRKLVLEHHVGQGAVTVAYSPDGGLLIGVDGKLLRRDRGDLTNSPATFNGAIRTEDVAIDLSAAGDVMVAGYGRYGADPGEGAIACWDLRRGKHWMLPGHDGSSVFDVAFVPSTDMVIAGGGPRHGPGIVRIWDAHTGLLAAELPKEEASVVGVAVAPTGDRLAVAALNRVTVWTQLDRQPKLLWNRESPGAKRVAFSPGGDVLAVGCFKGSRLITLLDAATGELLETASSGRSIYKLAFSQDGNLLASIDWYGQVALYDRLEHRTVLSEPAHQVVGTGLAFSPDGRTLATASTEGQIKFWNVPTLMHVTTLATHGRVAELAFFPDGKTLAVGYLDRTIELWHVDREKEQFSIDGEGDRQ